MNGTMIRRQVIGWVSVATTIGLAACGGSGLSESSTCSEFLSASSEDQRSVTQQLAGKYQKPDYATPLGMPAVPYFCSSNPKVTLKEFFQSAG